MASKKANKTCCGCKEVKSVDAFPKDRSTKDGLFAYCRECNNSRSRAYRMKNKDACARRVEQYSASAEGQETRRKWYQKHKCRISQQSKEYRKTEAGRRETRRAHLKTLYGITLEQHEQMYMGQNGCCRICGEAIPYSKIYTDHDHKTDSVRGLLCHGCNSGLGYFRDSLKNLRGAIKYLREKDGG